MDATALHEIFFIMKRHERKPIMHQWRLPFAFKIDSIRNVEREDIIEKELRVFKFHLFSQFQEGPVKNSLVLMGQLLSGLFSDLSLNEAQTMVSILLTNR